MPPRNPRRRAPLPLHPPPPPLLQAGLDKEGNAEAFSKLDLTRCGVLVGSGMGGLTVFQDGGCAGWRLCVVPLVAAWRGRLPPPWRAHLPTPAAARARKACARPPSLESAHLTCTAERPGPVPHLQPPVRDHVSAACAPRAQQCSPARRPP